MDASKLPEDADRLAVLELLHKALGDVHGRLRVADAQQLGGVQRPSHYRMGLIARALRQLGWERVRCRIDGKLSYAYAKGTRLQRETVLVVERDVDDRPVVTRTA